MVVGGGGKGVGAYALEAITERDLCPSLTKPLSCKPVLGSRCSLLRGCCAS